MTDGYSFSASQIESMSESTLQEPANFHLSTSSVLANFHLSTSSVQAGLGYCMNEAAKPILLNATAKLHVVMVPYPVQGQINPMMQFAKLLTARHEDMVVTMVNNKYNHDRIQTATRIVASVTDVSTIRKPQPDENKQLHFAWVDNGLPSDFDYSDLTTGSGFMDLHLSTLHMKEPLKQLLQSFNHQMIPGRPPVSCVLFGTFCPWAQSAAAELHIPTLLFWTQSAAMFSIYYHIPLLLANGFFPYNKKSLPGSDEDHIVETCDLSSGATYTGSNEDHTVETRDLVTYIPGLPPLLPSSFPTVLHVDDFSDPSLEIVKEQFSEVGNCDGVIINSYEELEEDTCQALQKELPCSIFLVGPLLPSASLDGNDMNDKTSGASSLVQEKSDCIKWLDGKQKQSVLYISFGSLFNPSVAEVEGIALGIKLSKQPYLWVLRPTNSADVSDILPKGFVEDTKDYGLIIPWAPQVQVLSHPSVGSFLTHCGWNSTLESLSMGVPMISFPIFLDQPTNSTYVCDVWKVGMALKRQGNGTVKSEDVEKAVRAVLQEEEGLQMRERAGKLRDAARLAIQLQGSSHAHIGKFIQALRNHANGLHLAA